MDIEIKIGREVESASDIDVPAECKRVSRNHAVLRWHDGSLTIEDSPSSNGTYVNGRRVVKFHLTEGDTVWLGSNGESDECYRLDLKKVFDSCRKAELERRTDFSSEFEDMKQAYQAYHSELAKLNKRSQLPLRVVSFLPTLVGAVLAVLPGFNPTDRITVIAVGGAVTGLINIMMTTRTGDSNSERLAKAKAELLIKYQPRYRCPKCGKDFQLSTHWRKLEADGECPNPKCNACFVKNDNKAIEP